MLEDVANNALGYLWLKFMAWIYIFKLMHCCFLQAYIPYGEAIASLWAMNLIIIIIFSFDNPAILSPLCHCLFKLLH